MKEECRQLRIDLANANLTIDSLHDKLNRAIVDNNDGLREWEEYIESELNQLGC